MKIYENWTTQAIDCYKRNCICKGCILNTLESKCEMKKTVIELVRLIGLPPERKLNGIKDAEKKVIEAIFDGCNTKSEIAEFCDFKEPKVQGILDDLCLTVQTQGYAIRAVRNRLPELIEILREIYDTRE